MATIIFILTVGVAYVLFRRRMQALVDKSVEEALRSLRVQGIRKALVGGGVTVMCPRCETTLVRAEDERALATLGLDVGCGRCGALVAL